MAMSWGQAGKRSYYQGVVGYYAASVPDQKWRRLGSELHHHCQLCTQAAQLARGSRLIFIQCYYRICD